MERRRLSIRIDRSPFELDGERIDRLGSIQWSPVVGRVAVRPPVMLSDVAWVDAPGENLVAGSVQRGDWRGVPPATELAESGPVVEQIVLLDARLAVLDQRLGRVARGPRRTAARSRVAGRRHAGLAAPPPGCRPTRAGPRALHWKQRDERVPRLAWAEQRGVVAAECGTPDSPCIDSASSARAPAAAATLCRAAG